MEQPPPLTPQEVSNMQEHQLGQPQTVKIFGVMHVILGVYGILMVALAVYTAVVGNPFLMFMPKTPAAAAQAEAQAAMQDRMMPFTIGSTFLMAAITALILIAGIKLLKKRRDGLKWSNRYAWTSLAGKVAGIAFAFLYTFPLMKEMAGASKSPMPGAMEGIMMGSMIVGVLIPCAYPILTLVLLNRPRTKEWFAAQPE